MEPNPYQSPSESGVRQQQGRNVFRWGGWGVVLWIFAGLAAIALADWLAMQFGLLIDRP